MKKNKILRCGLATMLVFTIKANALALDSDDIAYKMAYDATEKALRIRDQKEINEARDAIGYMPNSLYWAKGEFSKQLDSVQQPILEEIVRAIENAKESEAQQDINKARSRIPTDLPFAWRFSYSSAIDTVQDRLMKKVDKAISTAEKTRSNKDIHLANELINSVKSVDNNIAVSKWIEDKEYDFKETFKNQLSYPDGNSSKGGSTRSFDIECKNGKYEVIDDVEGADIVNISGEGSGTITLKGITVDEVNIDMSKGGVKLTDVTANKVYVKNMGKNSFSIVDSKIENMTIDDWDNNISLNVSGSKSEIESMEVNTGCTISAKDNIKSLTLNNSNAVSRVKINGSLKDARILVGDSGGLDLYAPINTLEILDNGSSPRISMYNSCKIDDMFLNPDQEIKLYFQERSVLTNNIKAINNKTGQDKIKELTGGSVTTNLNLKK